MIRKLILKILEAIGGNVFYIGGNDVLPPPLSPEEEKKIIKEFTAGSLDARNILIEHNLRLVVYIARKFENAGVNVEDLISIGTIGLIKAVNTFKSEEYKAGDICFKMYRKRDTYVSSQKQQD